MYIITAGKKLKKAWRYYRCPKCGEESIELLREGYAKLFSRFKFPDYILEPEVRVTGEKNDQRSCSNCGRAISPTTFNTGDYISIFKDLKITISPTSSYTLKYDSQEDDLFY